MRLMDTHVHWDDVVARDDVAAVVGRAQEAGVVCAVGMGASAVANRAACTVAELFPEWARVALGYDRSHAETLQGDALRIAMEALAGDLRSIPGVVAVGEIGLDYHYHPDTAAAQRRLFAAQLEVARDLSLPVCVHTREADADTLAALQEHVEKRGVQQSPPGVIHCFTGTGVFARAVVDMGFLLGISGVVTFKNASRLRATVAQVPEDMLVLETDAPYLTPEPHRGTVNEPARVVHVAEVLAEVRGVGVEAIAEATSRNAGRLFHRAGCKRDTA